MKKFLLLSIIVLLASSCSQVTLSNSQITELCQQKLNQYVKDYPGKNEPLNQTTCKYDEHKDENLKLTYLLTYTFVNGEKLTINNKGEVNILK